MTEDQKTPPPNLRHLSYEELPHLLLAENNLLRKNVRDKIPRFLCHSQDCERTLQMVTNKVLKTKGHDKQKNKIIVTQESRETISCQSTKAEVIRTFKK